MHEEQREEYQIRMKQKLDYFISLALQRFYDDSSFDPTNWLDEKDRLEFEYYREFDGTGFGDEEWLESILNDIKKWNEKNPDNKIELIN